MRFSFWTSIGALAVLSAACTSGEKTTATAASPNPSPAAAAAAPAVAPVAAAASPPDEGAPPLEVQLKADVSGGVGERKVKWEFGDGTPPSTETNPKHKYEKAGTFRASVEVADASGDSDSDYVDIETGAE